MKKLLSVLLSATLLVSGMALFAACTPNEPDPEPVSPTLKIVGDVQELYGGENGWPQAVLVAKKDFIAENTAFVEDFIAAMQANEGWLAAEDTQPQAIVDAITDHLGGANPTFNAKNLTKEVIANCAIRFEAAADCKEEVNAFLQSLTAVGVQGLSVSDDFYYQPDSDDQGSAATEVVADVYAPDGAPALSLAQLMSEDMQFGEGNTVTYNVVAASSIQTFVTGEEPQAELCVLPVNAAAKLLGKGEVYQMLGTVTHGNIYVLSAASKGYADLTSANLKEQLLGKTVGCIQLDNVVGLTLKVVLDNSDIPFEVIEDVSEATADDVVYLLNISDPATMITPAAPYDYMVAAEPVVSAKVNASANAAK